MKIERSENINPKPRTLAELHMFHWDIYNDQIQLARGEKERSEEKNKCFFKPLARRTKLNKGKEGLYKMPYYTFFSLPLLSLAESIQRIHATGFELKRHNYRHDLSCNYASYLQTRL